MEETAIEVAAPMSETRNSLVSTLNRLKEQQAVIERGLAALDSNPALEQISDALREASKPRGYD